MSDKNFTEGDDYVEEIVERDAFDLAIRACRLPRGITRRQRRHVGRPIERRRGLISFIPSNLARRAAPHSIMDVAVRRRPLNSNRLP